MTETVAGTLAVTQKTSITSISGMLTGAKYVEKQYNIPVQTPYYNRLIKKLIS
jgi:hypothetical protein